MLRQRKEFTECEVPLAEHSDTHLRYIHSRHIPHRTRRFGQSDSIQGERVENGEVKRMRCNTVSVY